MAKQRANVPKFGNWENGGVDVPYTVCFDKARQSKTGGKMINPNDPLENPEMFGIFEPSPLAAPAPPPKSRSRHELAASGRGPVRPTPERIDDEVRPFNNSSSGRNEPIYGRQGQGQGQGQKPARSSRVSAGLDQSFDRSPLHPQYHQPKVSGGSPAREGRNHDSSHGTPARSRLRPVSRESPERGVPVPEFGKWDENDPNSAENFTIKFDKLREEKKIINSNGGGNASATPKHSLHEPRPRPSNDKYNPKSAKCCFPLW